MGRDFVQRLSWRKAMRHLALGRRLTSSSYVVGHRCSVDSRGILFFLMLFSLNVSAFRPGLVTRQCRNIKAPFGLVISSTTPFSATSSTADLYASTAPLQLTATYECLFDIQVPEGRCVGLTLPDLPDDHPDALVGDRILESSGSSSSSSTNGSIYYSHEEPQQRHWIYSHLHADEIRYGLQLSRPTQASFWMGRLALRKALSSSSTPCTAVSTRSILKDSHGRPQLPPGYLGSISHKGRTGVALVAPAPAPSGEYSLSSSSPSTALHRPCLGIGVDIEESKPKRRSIARKVLTPNEQRNLGQLPVRIAASRTKDT